MAVAISLAITLSAPPAAGQHMNAPDGPCRDVVVTSDAAACLSDALASRDKDLALLLDQIRPAVAGDELKLLNSSQTA